LSQIGKYFSRRPEISEFFFGTHFRNIVGTHIYLHEKNLFISDPVFGILNLFSQNGLFAKFIIDICRKQNILEPYLAYANYTQTGT
jgi:hypothetical protein